MPYSSDQTPVHLQSVWEGGGLEPALNLPCCAGPKGFCEFVKAAAPGQAAAVLTHLVTLSLHCSCFSGTVQTLRPNPVLLFMRQELNAKSPKEAKDLKIAPY